MSHHQIAVVIGSLRRNSYNRQLGNAIKRLAPAGLSFYDLRIDDLPLYNQDDDANQAEPVQRLKREVAPALGLILVTPEYHRPVPGALKTAIDHPSRPCGQSAWRGKRARTI